jgi:hypothetical protein
LLDERLHLAFCKVPDDRVGDRVSKGPINIGRRSLAMLLKEPDGRFELAARNF